MLNTSRIVQMGQLLTQHFLFGSINISTIVCVYTVQLISSIIYRYQFSYKGFFLTNTQSQSVHIVYENAHYWYYERNSMESLCGGEGF